MFTKRVRRYLGAGIAAAVTTFVGLYAAAPAEAESCNLRDATHWQLALNDPQVEQTPAYILSVTERFLEACPHRPEFAEANRIAAIAAADLGEAKRAVRYFRDAGSMRDLFSNFYAIAAFVAAEEPDQAWRQRDRMVELWRTRLERHPLVSVSAEPTDTGMIYQVYFTETDEDTGLRAAWVAVPIGPGWPATLTFSHDPFRFALRKVRAGELDETLRFVDLHRCEGRRSLGEITTKLSVTEFDAAAHASLSAYLANPDQPEPAIEGPVRTCVFPTRLLPNPPRR